MTSLEVRMLFVNVRKTCNDLNYDSTTDLSTTFAVRSLFSSYFSRNLSYI